MDQPHHALRAVHIRLAASNALHLRAGGREGRVLEDRHTVRPSPVSGRPLRALRSRRASLRASWWANNSSKARRRRGRAAGSSSRPDCGACSCSKLSRQPAPALARFQRLIDPFGQIGQGEGGLSHRGASRRSRAPPSADRPAAANPCRTSRPARRSDRDARSAFRWRNAPPCPTPPGREPLGQHAAQIIGFGVEKHQVQPARLVAHAHLIGLLHGRAGDMGLHLRLDADQHLPASPASEIDTRCVRSTSPVGAVKSRSFTRGPATFSINTASRGPTPFSVVRSANSGKSD
jgi:hypothetical protein